MTAEHETLPIDPTDPCDPRARTVRRGSVLAVSALGLSALAVPPMVSAAVFNENVSVVLDEAQLGTTEGGRRTWTVQILPAVPLPASYVDTSRINLDFGDLDLALSGQPDYLPLGEGVPGAVSLTLDLSPVGEGGTCVQPVSEGCTPAQIFVTVQTNVESGIDISVPLSEGSYATAASVTPLSEGSLTVDISYALPAAYFRTSEVIVEVDSQGNYQVNSAQLTLEAPYLDIVDPEAEDDDNDGRSNAREGGNEEPPRDRDDDGYPDYLDVDSDNDDTPDSVEYARKNDDDGGSAGWWLALLTLAGLRRRR